MRVLTCIVLNLKTYVCKACGQKERYKDCADHVCAENQPSQLVNQPRAITAAAGDLWQPEPVLKNNQKTVEGKLTLQAE